MEVRHFKHNQLGSLACLLPQEVTTSHMLQGTMGPFPTDHWGERQNNKGGVNTCTIGAKVAAIEAGKYSLGKEWMKATQRKLPKILEVGYFEKSAWSFPNLR